MPNKKMTDKHKAVAYVCNKELDIPQQRIADMMKFGQSTVSTGIKDFGQRMQIHCLEQQLEEARNYIKSKGLLPEHGDEDDILYIDDNRA